MKELLEKSLLQKIERLEAFEDRMKIRLENISVRVNEHNWLKLFCEAHPINGTTINEDITLECVIYDLEGAILVVNTNYMYADEFFGFEVLEFSFSDSELVDKIGKIRVYPKKR